MNIFESLENLNVSEECFDEIMGIVEAILSESEDNNWEPAKYKNKWHVYNKTTCTYDAVKGGRKGAEKRCKELNTAYPVKPVIDTTYEEFVDEEVKDHLKGKKEDLLTTVYGAMNTKRMRKGKKMLSDEKIKNKKCLENLNVSEECFDEIMGIIEELLGEGREPFETQQQYKRRLQQHFGPILNDKLASQKSTARHYDKKAKGLKKETKKAYIENQNATKKYDEEYEKYHDSIDKSIEAGNAHGYDSDLYKKAKKEQEDAKIKRNEARENAKKSGNNLRKARIEQYDAENSADIARGEQDEISNKIGKTGTHFYRH